MFETLLVVVVAGVLIFVLMVVIAAASSTPNNAVQEQGAELRAKLDRLIAAKREWREKALAGLLHPTDGSLTLNGTGLDCVFAIDRDQKALRIFGYTTREQTFAVVSEATIPIAEILSVEVVRPMRKTKVKRTQAVPIVTTKKKSPVARGIVGGVLLGPAGLVLGAASGIGRDTTTKVEERIVWEDAERQGEAELHIGTASMETPFIKITPTGSAMADEWAHRLRAAQVAGATPLKLK